MTEDPFDTSDPSLHPMTTAPKDGTFVTLIGYTRTADARWHDDQWRLHTGEPVSDFWSGWVELHDEMAEMYALLV